MTEPGSISLLQYGKRKMASNSWRTISRFGCRQLSERQCDCQASSYDRNTCLQRAATNESTFVPTAGDNQRCAELVEQCDCRLIDTPEGKRKCGFARRDACDADRDAGCVEDGGY